MTNMEMVVSHISRIIEFDAFIFMLCVNVANQGQQIPNGLAQKGKNIFKVNSFLESKVAFTCSLSLSKLQLNRFNTTNGVSYKGKITVK